jgi:hypothetical protein
LDQPVVASVLNTDFLVLHAFVHVLDEVLLGIVNVCWVAASQFPSLSFRKSVYDAVPPFSPAESRMVFTLRLMSVKS